MDYSNLIKYLEQSLRAAPGVADKSLYKDSQTKYVLDILSHKSGNTKLLDYGCGNMRLLSGILSKQGELDHIEYVGTDVVVPSDDSLAMCCNDHRFLETAELRQNYKDYFDFAVVMNVIHEIPIVK